MVLKSRDLSLALVTLDFVILVDRLETLLLGDHRFLQSHALVIDLIDDSRDDTLTLTLEVDAICCHDRIDDRIHRTICKDYVRRHTRSRQRHDRLRRHVVLNNEIRVQRVKVERANPFVLARLHFLDITAWIVALDVLLARRDGDRLARKISVDDAVPDRSGSERVVVIDTADVSQSQGKCD